MAGNDAKLTRRAGDIGISPLLDGLCMDCGVDTRATGEYYALKDSLWHRINPLVIGTAVPSLCRGSTRAITLWRRFRPLTAECGLREELSRARQAPEAPEAGNP